MTNGRKLLIDTNVVIGLEDWKEIPVGLARLQMLCSQHGHRLFVHEAAVSDINRDTDISRRRITLSKLEKFERLVGIKTPTDTALAEKYGKISSQNDHVDVALLYALELGAADFLVTQDQGIHARARRVSSDLADRVLSVAECLSWLVAEHEPKTVHLPLVEELPAHAIDPQDAIFESLRDGYQGFDKWWRDKCIAEHRPCWVVTIGGALAGIVVRKDETIGSGPKILKLCTFKVKPEFRGEKLGELLLKQALWFAQRNGYDNIYLTTRPEQATLISVLTYYGFMEVGRNAGGEVVLSKDLPRDRLIAGQAQDLATLTRLNYPRFSIASPVKAFCVPIRGEYHDMLFPELEDRSQIDLFEAMGLSVRPRTPGNTIRKIYLCRAQTNQIGPSSAIFFYRSSSGPSALSQSITTVGVVERVSRPADAESLVRLTAKRSVYSAAQLNLLISESERPVKAIDFLLIGHLERPVRLPELLELGVFARHPPQSITHLSRARLEPLLEHMTFGFDL